MADQPLSPASPERRLAAILAADIAGYSRLMGKDEAATVRELKAHQAVVLPMIESFGGSVVDTAGDGILAAFSLFQSSQLSEEGSREALGLLERSIRADPDHAQALGLKAWIVVWRSVQGWGAMDRAVAEAKSASVRATAANADEPWGWVGQGCVGIATRDNAIRHQLIGADRCSRGRPCTFILSSLVVSDMPEPGGAVHDRQPV